MATNRDRRITHSFGYHSSNPNYLANRPKAPFSKIRQIYGEELERFNQESTDYNVKNEPLPSHVRRTIKNRVRRQMAEEQLKNMVAYGLSGFLVFLIIALLSYYLPRFL